MARYPKLYENSAERQAAYRRRHAFKKPLTLKERTARVEDLLRCVKSAALAGDELAQQVSAATTDELLTNLIDAFARRENGVKLRRLFDDE